MAITVQVKSLFPADKKLKKVVKDKSFLTAAHTLLFKMMTPFVPFDTGTLSQNVEITSEYVRYKQPYAHYMYHGIVYGPNIPIIQNGVVVGFFSRPGVKKTPTGEYINYDKAHHPMASSHWDEAMINVKGDSFRAQLLALLNERYKQL